MTAASARYDIVIRNALLIDGTGAPARPGDLAVAAGLIARIDAAGAIPAAAATVIEAEGRALSPGFIDTHTHDDRAVIDTDMLAKVSQGVTTVVTGNCGISLAPIRLAGSPPPPLNLLGSTAAYEFPRFADYAERLDRQPPGVNVAALIGHGTLRVGAMQDIAGRATKAELAAMRGRLQESLEAGAIGFSSGLYYDINAGADADEVVALAELVGVAGGVYATHMRDEAAKILDSLDETFATGRRAKVPVVVSHHKCAQPDNWGRSRETLPVIEEAARHQPVALDAYPYTAGSTVLDPSKLRDDVRTLVTWSEPYPEMAGRDLNDVAADWGCSRDEAAHRLLPAGAIYFQMDEADVRRILAFPLTMIGSDGLPHDKHPHPRLWGTFPRVLGHYAREVGLFSMEEAVRKMTGLPAASFGLAGRGLLREGHAADLVLFDRDEVKDAATFEDPTRPSLGIAQVIVNGEIAWTCGGRAVRRVGRLLRRATTAAPLPRAP